MPSAMKQNEHWLGHRGLDFEVESWTKMCMTLWLPVGSARWSCLPQLSTQSQQHPSRDMLTTVAQYDISKDESGMVGCNSFLQVGLDSHQPACVGNT